MIYYYKIELLKNEIDVDLFMETIRKTLKSNVCGRKGMMEIIKSGGKYMYVYVGAGGLAIGSIEIGKSECGVI